MYIYMYWAPGCLSSFDTHRNTWIVLYERRAVFVGGVFAPVPALYSMRSMYLNSTWFASSRSRGVRAVMDVEEVASYLHSSFSSFGVLHNLTMRSVV